MTAHIMPTQAPREAAHASTISDITTISPAEFDRR